MDFYSLGGGGGSRIIRLGGSSLVWGGGGGGSSGLIPACICYTHCSSASEATWEMGGMTTQAF